MNNGTGKSGSSIQFKPNLNQRKRNLVNNKSSQREPAHGLPKQFGRDNQTLNRPYFSDPLLLVRVSDYLRNIGRQQYLNFDVMMEELQRDYPEYRRRKKGPFRHHLMKAIDVIKFDNNEGDEDDSDDIIDADSDGADYQGNKSPAYAFEGDGDVNTTLEDSYLQNAKRRKISDNGQQELISIVTSDEDNNDEPINEPVKNTSKKLSSVKKSPPKPLEEVQTPAVKSKPPETQTAKKRKAETLLNSNKRFKNTLEPVQPSVSFKDIGGNEKVLQEVTQLLIHLRHPEVYRILGVSPPRGFLLHGPPGSGKTLLANAIAGELKLPLLKVAAPELVGGLSGQSEERIRELFEQAVALAPCILFIDEVDAITPNRETAHREMERRIVAQLLSSMDDLSNSEQGDQVLVIGATNRPDSLDPALRRAGRFDREVCLGIPDRESRESILRTLCHSLRLTPELNLCDVAALTPGYVGADLKSLVTEAAMAAVNRLFKSLKESSEQTSESIEDSKVPLQTDDKNKDEPNDVKDDLMDVSEDKSEELTIVVDRVGEPFIENKELTEQKAETSKPAEDSQKEKDDECEEEIQVVGSDNEDTSDDIQVLDVESHKEDGECENVEVKEEEKTEESQETKPPPPPQALSLLHSDPLTSEQLEGVYITIEDFKVALKAVQPSAKREGFATVPDVKWEDIGSLQDIRHELQMAILAPVKYPQEFARMGLNTPTGVLLCGPPGCGKTLLAKAVANEAGINFISVKGPELLNMYVGESERAVRQCFQRARSSVPCVIFFDEIDALCPKRSNMETSGASRVVNQLLTEMDGVEARPGVFLMAATNRPDIVDPAVMRPGRLDKVLYVGLPAPADRVDILRALTKGGKEPVLADDVDLTVVGGDQQCEGYTGADLAALVREASLHALKEFMNLTPDHQTNTATSSELKVCSRHFTSALQKIRPSVSERDKKRYEDLRLQYAAVPPVL